jgi:hypothetical protein
LQTIVIDSWVNRILRRVRACSAIRIRRFGIIQTNEDCYDTPEQNCMEPESLAYFQTLSLLNWHELYLGRIETGFSHVLTGYAPTQILTAQRMLISVYDEFYKCVLSESGYKGTTGSSRTKVW